MLSFCGKPSLFDEIFIGAEGDVLHTEIAYTRIVYVRKHSASWLWGTRQQAGGVHGLRFKSKRLTVVDEVHAKCETVIITKHGKPVAKLVPVNAGKDEIYDFLASKGAIVGDSIPPK